MYKRHQMPWIFDPFNNPFLGKLIAISLYIRWVRLCWDSQIIGFQNPNALTVQSHVEHYPVISLLCMLLHKFISPQDLISVKNYKCSRQLISSFQVHITNSDRHNIQRKQKTKQNKHKHNVERSSTKYRSNFHSELSTQNKLKLNSQEQKVRIRHNIPNWTTDRTETATIINHSFSRKRNLQ